MPDGLENQRRMFEALASGRAFGVSTGQVERIETHISCVFLAGDHAYKIKKALDLGFLDFSGLDQRRLACQEELRLNARLASDVYLRVAALTGDPDAPTLDGDGPVIDYAVVMRRFPQSALLSHMLTRGELLATHIEELAALLADFHEGIPAAAPERDYGTPATVAYWVEENLKALPGLMPGSGEVIQALGAWTRARLAGLRETIARRVAGGRVRECHGDLHLDNIIHWHGRIMAFDGIEFNAELRWIDVASELAFVTMDLDDREAGGYARQLRNAYLERTGDYDALSVLAFYQVYRALVRAKVNALQARQGGNGAGAHMDAAGAYLRLARSYTAAGRPALVLMQGVTGTGKSTLAETLVRERGYLRLRSDVVRKRLHGLRPGDRSAELGLDIYTAEASRRTYQRLLEQARTVLERGYPVVLDATFLKRAHREPFLELAVALDVPWRLVSLQGRPERLRERVARRARAGGDPSEADVGVLEQQLEEQEALTDAERAGALVLDIESVPSDWYRRLPA